MRRATSSLVILALLAELLLFRFAPGASPAITLPFHALVAAVAALLAVRSSPGRRALPVLLLLLSAGLSVLVAASRATAREAPPDETSWREAVEKTADTARGSLESVLAQERSFVLALPADLLSGGASRPELFDRLAELERSHGRSQDGPGLALYDADGQALAWAGETSILRGALDLVSRPPHLVQLVHKAALRTSFVTLRGSESGTRRIAAAEVLLDSPSSPGAWRRLVRLPASAGVEIGAEFLEPGESDAALLEFLAAGGERYWTRGGVSSQMIVPVRAGSDDVLGLLTFSPERVQEPAPGAGQGEVYRQALLVAALLVALAFGFAQARRTRTAAELGLLALLLLLLRLAVGSLAAIVPGPGILDYRLFSTPVPLGLAASPADIFLTAVTAFGVAGIAAIAIRKSGRYASVAGVAASIGIAGALFALTGAWVTNSSLNPEHVPVLPPEAPHLALGWAHALFAGSAAILAMAGLAARGRALTARAVAACLLAAGAASHLMLVREAAKVPQAIIVNALAPEVLRARSAAHDRLVDLLADADSDPRWRAAVGASGGARDVLAFEGWRESELGRTGARSALAVTDLSGEILSSFAYGLPDSVLADTAPAEPTPLDRFPVSGVVVSDASLQVLSLRVPLLRGERILHRAGAAAGRLVAVLSAETDDLPFLTRGDPLLRSLGNQGAERIYDEYFGGAPLFIAYTPAGEVIVPSAEQMAPLDPSLVHLSAPVWTTTRFAGTAYRTYVFPTEEGPRAIGYAAPSLIATIAGLLRSCLLLVPALLSVLLLGALLTAPGPAAGLSPAAWMRWMSGSYSRRLQAVVLACSLVPLILLAFIFSNTIERRTREAVEQAGVQSAATIRRLLEDYVDSVAADPSGAVPIGSRTLFWMARTVHQDIHLFAGQELVATSRGDPEASGLRSFRLDASVARALARSHPPQVLADEPLSERRTALVYAPVRLRGSPDGVLALPLLVQERDLTRGGEAVANALLVATFALGVLLAGVGYMFARRLSVPIHELAHAARTIAGGQLEVRVQPRGRDEIRQLVDAFNGMARALAEQREDLRRRRDYIEAILLNVTTGVISTDPAGIVRTANPAASLLLGLPFDLAGKNLFAELRRRQELAPILELWSSGEASAPGAAPREISIRRGREEMRLRSVVLPLAEAEGGAPGSIFLVEDVTEVLRSHRLAAWAEMARRIAHEIKNPLTPIQLSAEHLLRVRSDGSEDYDRVLRQCVETILAQVRALREISSEFSTYARLPDLRLAPTDLGELVESVVAPYRTSSPPGVSIELRLDAVPLVQADPRVLRRALVNLAENALQAMEGGGTLTVSLARREGPDGAVAEIVFEDTGEGMDDATRARIFEPYFSTRDGGTGLGLAIARRAVEEHGGTLAAEPAHGQGTRMILRIPLSRQPEPPPEPPARIPDATPAGHRRPSNEPEKPLV